MAQTIAEKLAEKYDVTPSTTIAGTLKKITNDETGDVNIASLVGKMEAGGGGSSRVLLYENDTLDISTEGTPGIHFIGNNKTLPFIDPTYFNETDDVYTLEIDGEIAVQGKPNSGCVLGIKSPVDTDSVTAGIKAGVTITFFQPTQTKILHAIGNICINDNFYSAGTHSVKLYKEV